MYNINKNMPLSVRLSKRGLEWASKNNIMYDDNNCIKVSLEQLFLILEKSNLIESNVFVSDDDFERFGEHTTKDIYDLELSLGSCKDNDLIVLTQKYILDMKIRLLKNDIELKMMELQNLERAKNGLSAEINSKKNTK